ncbi:MAG TPA: protein adenylyltransferase SelO family protein, partial [Sphingomicrobium sp.]
AYFDYNGLYSFARQPEAIHWDLAQLAGSLTLLSEAPPLAEALGQWTARFEDALVAALLERLGVAGREPEADRTLAAALIAALQSRAAPIDRIFFDWRGGRDPGVERYPSEPFRALAAALRGREVPAAHAYWSDADPCSMHIEEVEAIWSAIAASDDWAPFNAKVDAIRRMGEAMAAAAPAPVDTAAA